MPEITVNLNWDLVVVWGVGGAINLPEGTSIDWIAFAGVVFTAAGLIWQHFWTKSEFQRAHRRGLYERTVQIPLENFLAEILRFEHETYRTEDNAEGADVTRLIRQGKKLIREGSIALQSARQNDGERWNGLGLKQVETLILEMNSEPNEAASSIAIVREETRWLYAAINGQLLRSMKESK